jgi:DNA modification methylase
MSAKKSRKPKEATARWLAENCSLRPLTEIKPYEHNTRVHDTKQVAMLARLMQQYGVDQPIVVDEDGVILKGHGRRLAAYVAGFSVFPVVVNAGLSDAAKREVRIADNNSALLAEWNDELMGRELKTLELGGSNLELLGFDAEQLAHWGIGQIEETRDVDHIPEPVQNPSVRQGDLYLLGDHRLLCGDSTLRENWDRLMNPVERAAMVFTDPPYGVSYAAGSGKFVEIRGDGKRHDDLYRMLLAGLTQLAAKSSDAAAFYIWHASSTREDFAQAMTAAGLTERQYLIWVKPSIVLGHADYMWQHEPCFYASKGSGKAAFYGNRSDSTVWQVQTGGGSRDVAATIGNGILVLDGAGASIYVQSRIPKNRKLRQLRVSQGHSVYLAGGEREDGTVWEVARDGGYQHPTQKPVELARRAIGNSSRPGEIVIDGFLGSGTTLIGAEVTGRRCFGIELDPVYAQVTIDRWEKLTGRKAEKSEGHHAAGDSGKPVRGRRREKPQVRESGHARQPHAGRKPARQPSAVAGDS